MYRLVRHPVPFDLFNSPLQRQWKQDRALRQRVPFIDAWRGCLDVAAAIDQGATFHRIGHQMLIPTEQVKWFCLRDIPAQHFPRSKAMNRREVNYANGARAILRYGTPMLNFNVASRDAWDFRFMPFGSFRRTYGKAGVELVEAAGDVLNADRFPREFAILNEMSFLMTRFAFCGMNSDERPTRSPWYQRRPRDAEPFGIESPETWMPVPYLAFPASLRDQLYHLVTHAQDRGTCFECPRCRCVIHQEMLAGVSIRVFEDGNFVAACPRCRGFRKWYLSDAFPASNGRSFSMAFRRGFCAAVAEGLPIRTTEEMRYIRVSRESDGTGPDLIGHQFRSMVDGRAITISLPRKARIYVFSEEDPDSYATTIPAGALIGRALGQLPGEHWKCRSPAQRWSTLHEICGGTAFVGALQQLWFDQQIVPNPCSADQILVPSSLVASIVHDVVPLALWWDFAAGSGHLNSLTQAFVFPPIRLHRWNQLRHMLPGGVDLDAGIADPRFSPTPISNGTGYHHCAIAS